MIVHKIELETGRYICPVNVGDMSPEEAGALSPAYIVDEIPDGMIPDRWNGEAWEFAEPAASDEIEAAPSLEARIAALESATLEVILGGL